MKTGNKIKRVNGLFSINAETHLLSLFFIVIVVNLNTFQLVTETKKDLRVENVNKG